MVAISMHNNNSDPVFASNWHPRVRIQERKLNYLLVESELLHYATEKTIIMLLYLIEKLKMARLFKCHFHYHNRVCINNGIFFGGRG